MASLVAPFPYFGGKRHYAEEVWRRFGPADVYAEPFAGSLAVLLANPFYRRLPPSPRREIVTDTDGHICNVWRSVLNAPDETVEWADHPTIHQDLTARHKWLRRWSRDNAHRLSEDPDYYDAQAAGWWLWGKSNWIGKSWCSEGNREAIPFRHQSLSGQGVQAARTVVPYYDGDANPFRGWFNALCDRLWNVVVLNSDWTRAVSDQSLAKAVTENKNVCVFIDPPYAADGRFTRLYADDADGARIDKTAAAAFDWSVAHGDRYRIAYCCGKDDFPVPHEWSVVERKYAGKRNNRDDASERVMFSPSCIDEKGQSDLFS